MSKINVKSFNMEANATAVKVIKADGSIVITTTEAMNRAKRTAMAAKKPKKVKKTKNSVTIIKEHTLSLTKGIKVLKSLCCYRQYAATCHWGKIAQTNIIDNPIIAPCFAKFYTTYTEVEKQMELIEKEKSNDIYQLIERLGYLLDDIKTALVALYQAVNQSKVCETFAEHPMIIAEGKELGLGVLMARAMLSMHNIESAYKEMMQLSKEGVHINDYNIVGTFSKF